MNDTATPLVSVVIPTYNHARYLGRALQSVMDQTYTHWEAIVIDNHSTDNTDEVMTRFIDHRITYLKIHNHGVIAASRNAGIRTAKGEWTAFLDSDDWWVADKLQACFECINDKVDLVYHNLELITDEPRFYRPKIIKSRQVTTPVLIDLMARDSAIATSSVMVRTKLVKQLNGMNECPDMVGAEDYNTWLRIAQLTDGFRYVSKLLGFYQLHDRAVSSQKDMSVPTRHAASDFIDLLDRQQINKFEARLSYTRGRHNYLTGNYIVARKYLLASIRHGQCKSGLKSLWMISVIYVLGKK